MKRYIWPVVAILLLILSVHQLTLIHQYRTEIGLYGTKVTNAFRYTGLHMDLTALPAALNALASDPNKETLARAESAANDYTDLLFQINDLRESGPPMGDNGLQGGSGDFSYNPSTQEQADEQQQAGQIGPELEELARRIKGHRATVPVQ